MIAVGIKRDVDGPQCQMTEPSILSWAYNKDLLHQCVVSENICLTFKFGWGVFKYVLLMAASISVSCCFQHPVLEVSN